MITKKIEFPKDNYLFLLNFSEETIQRSIYEIERYKESLERVKNNSDDFKIYDWQTEKFEQAKKDLEVWTHMREILIGVYEME